ncbi:MAG: hypothetical protein IKJ55_00925 [Clostridia bacterium]|nr:hypothetical protein [Clostridia bacterium]
MKNKPRQSVADQTQLYDFVPEQYEGKRKIYGKFTDVKMPLGNQRRLCRNRFGKT